MSGAEGIWEISMPFSQVCCEQKITLKKSLNGGGHYYSQYKGHMLWPRISQTLFSFAVTAIGFFYSVLKDVLKARFSLSLINIYMDWTWAGHLYTLANTKVVLALVELLVLLFGAMPNHWGFHQERPLLESWKLNWSHHLFEWLYFEDLFL